MEWISVEERLPENDGAYLVHRYSGNLEINLYRRAERGWLLHFPPVERSEITHWTPLPGPPEAHDSDLHGTPPNSTAGLMSELPDWLNDDGAAHQALEDWCGLATEDECRAYTIETISGEGTIVQLRQSTKPRPLDLKSMRDVGGAWEQEFPRAAMFAMTETVKGAKGA